LNGKGRYALFALRALWAAVFPALLTVSACTAPPMAPAAQPAASDPVRQGHSHWCGMSPPSGYCDLDDSR
jgi:hypothetical protein